MLPDMSDVLSEWGDSVNITVRTITTTRVDFVDTEVAVDRTVNGVVQPGDIDELQPETIDYSLDYKCIHIKTQKGFINKNEYVVGFEGKNYIAKWVHDYRRYGFSEVILEEYKQTLPEPV